MTERPPTSPSAAGSPTTEFARGLAAVRLLSYRSEFLVQESPAPARLAPHGFAQTVEVNSGDLLMGTGRLVILHDPAGQESWQGTTRVIAYIDADVDLEVAADPMLPEVGWEWLNEALNDADAAATALGGTATQVNSRSFGVMADRPAEGRLQVRASWTPVDDEQLAAHARAWALLMAAACGLAPTDSGVPSLPTRRPRN